MAKKVYAGVDGVARRIKFIYMGGVGNVARRIKKVYVGVNGVARQCFPAADPANLFTQSGGTNTSKVSNFTVGFTYQTSTGQAYENIRLTRTGSSPNYYLQGKMEDSSGNGEHDLYVCSSNDVSMTAYTRLCVTYQYRYTDNSASPPSTRSLFFGAYKTASSALVCKSNELTGNYRAYKSQANSPASSWTEKTLTVDISAVTGNQRVLFIWSWPNMKGTAEVRIKKIWMD